MSFSKAMLGSLSNGELAIEARNPARLDANTVEEIVKRFVDMVDDETIPDCYDEDSRVVSRSRDDEEDLRDAIREAISVLESV